MRRFACALVWGFVGDYNVEGVILMSKGFDPNVLAHQLVRELTRRCEERAAARDRKRRREALLIAAGRSRPK